MRKRTLSVLSLALLVGACSPRDYVHSADSQVKGLLKDRLSPTLGYHPDTKIDDPIPAKAAPVAFNKIPVSPVPPPSFPALRPAWTDAPAGPLGPPFPPPAIGAATTQPSSQEDLALTENELSRDWRAGPPAPREAGVTFDLFQSLHYAVRHSRDYKTQLENLYLSALDVTLQRHLFEPRPFAQIGESVAAGPSGLTTDLDYQAALTATATAGVQQQLPYGGTVTAKALVGFVNALNGPVASGESAAVAMSASIPLLRGFGMVNLEPLISSERNLIYQIRAFEEYRRQFLVSIASSYFRLVTNRQALAINRANYISLIGLTERTEALYAAGRLNFLEVQRSLQAQLTAENRLVNAQEDYQSALDQFKIVMGMPIEQDLDIASVQLVLNLPSLGMKQAVEMAMKYRLDLQTGRDRIDDNRRQVQVAENQLQPDLNLTASGQWGNVPGAPARDLNNRTFNYSAGVTLDLPVDRLAERNSYRASIINFHRAERSFETLREQIAVDARDALRTIQSAEQTLRIQKMGIDLARRRLDYANELLKQGKATALDVVDAQSSLLDASNSYEEARAQLQISLLQYLQATGTLRVDPSAGALGRAMNRMVAGQADAAKMGIVTP
jgi:hypothetical protein